MGNRFLIFFSIVIFLLNSCNRNADNPQSEVIAKVGNKSLIMGDIKIPPGLSREDSISLIKQASNEWILRQLYYQKAKENIDENDSIIKKQLEEYKTTLLIHKYKQNLLNEKIDTVIPESEIVEYYEHFKSQFLLKSTIVRAYVIKVPASHTKQAELVQLLNSNREESLGAIKDICYQNARYFNFDIRWRTLSSVLSEAGVSQSQLHRDAVSNGRLYEFDAGDLKVLIKILDIKPAGEITPYEMAYNEIKTLLLFKRREKFLLKLENELFQNAIRKGDIYRKFPD
ncbi:MAG TPA: hypothetical protein PK990_00795 [Salinivirgaceae bacterium]|nr:hypothetical protein [Salinivirgaceae bacterium]